MVRLLSAASCPTSFGLVSDRVSTTRSSAIAFALLKRNCLKILRMVKHAASSPHRIAGHAARPSLRPRAIEVLGASVNGHDLGSPPMRAASKAGPWSFEYANPPVEGIDLQLRVQLRGGDFRCGRSLKRLPTIPGGIFPSRPADSYVYPFRRTKPWCAAVLCLAVLSLAVSSSAVLVYNDSREYSARCLCLCGAACELSICEKSARAQEFCPAKGRKSALYAAARSAKCRSTCPRTVSYLIAGTARGSTPARASGGHATA